MKQKFLNNEIWILTFGGGFQRSNTYKKGLEETQRKEFREALRSHVEKIVKDNYEDYEVTPADHLQKIQSVINFSKAYKRKDILTNNQLSFGVAQKILNLYLKYLWCQDKILTPPHFPVDRIIQKKLGKKESEIISWTKDLNEHSYNQLMAYAKLQLKENNCESLAELEMLLFQRN